MHLNKNYNTKLESAIALFQSGDLDTAQNILDQIIKTKKAPAISWFISAVIHVQKSENVQAITAFDNALLTQPVYPDAHNNLGVVLEIQNRTQDALKHYKKAIQQRPIYANALFNFANLMHKQGDLNIAEKNYKLALEADKKYIKVYNNLGLLYQKRNQLEKARTCFEMAIELDENDFEIFSNMGYLCYLEENFETALSFYQKSLELRPDSPDVLNNTGMVLQSLHRYDEAENHYNRAISKRNNYPEAITNLANLYKEIGKPELAENKYFDALQLNPDYPPANNNYGLLLHHNGDYADAKGFFESALKGDKEFSEARYNLGTNQLMSGLYTEGWKNCLSRPMERHPLAVDISNINLSNLTNKRILLLRDLGIGDELFFLRFSEQLYNMGNSITYLATPKIKTLISHIPHLTSIIEDESQIRSYDYAISVADLPALLVNNNENIPPSYPLNYVEKYRKNLKNKLNKLGPAPYIGISWRGGQKIKNMLFKSIPVNPLLDALKDVKATFISLQRMPSSEEIIQLKQHEKFSDLPDFGYLNDDLPQMLSLLSLLDDYIGVSNTNMHLRASLKKKAKVFVPHPPEWRWMLSGNSSPWFPEFNIYRQFPNGDWSAALKKLSQTLISTHGRSN